MPESATIHQTDDDHVTRILRSTIAYASGVSESVLVGTTRIAELGIDSVAMIAAGVVLQSELEVELLESDIVRIFTADTVSDATAVLFQCIGASGRDVTRRDGAVTD